MQLHRYSNILSTHVGRVQFRATSIVDGCAHVSLSPLTFGAARYGEVPVARGRA